MVRDTNPTPDDVTPTYDDRVLLRAGALADVDEDTELHVVDLAHSDLRHRAPGTEDLLILHYPDDHPRYWDWAAAVPVDQVAAVIRLTDTGPRTWHRPADL